MGLVRFDHQRLLGQALVDGRQLARRHALGQHGRLLELACDLLLGCLFDLFLNDDGDLLLDLFLDDDCLLDDLFHDLRLAGASGYDHARGGESSQPQKVTTRVSLQIHRSPSY
jgi:hypothetical protein